MQDSDTLQHLLIIDDDELIVGFLEDYLTDIGYKVTSVNSAEDAIQFLFSNEKYDLVLTDVNLPGKSGLDLLKIVNETKNGLPVVLFTGRRSIDTAITALQHGADDFITKPFDLSTVSNVIEKALKKKNRDKKRGQIYNYLRNLKFIFEFTSREVDSGILAKEIADILHRMQFGDENAIRQYELAFTESLLNGLEHGNLELPSVLKSDNVLNRSEYDKLREERLNDPEFANRKIKLIFECNIDFFSFKVKDSGNGFDWKKYLDENHKINNTNLNPYGRGFMLISKIIDKVFFNSIGNEITLIKHRVPKLELINK